MKNYGNKTKSLVVYTSSPRCSLFANRTGKSFSVLDKMLVSRERDMGCLQAVMVMQIEINVEET